MSSTAPRRFAGLDPSSLINYLLNPILPRADQKDAIDELTRRKPEERAYIAQQVLVKMFERQHDYKNGTLDLIDLLGTDPDSSATTAMLNALPAVVSSAEKKLKSEAVRNYFYTVLLTRQREGDKEVWRDRLAGFGSETLIGLLNDPAAKSFCEAMDPVEIMDRLPEPKRSQVLREAVVQARARDGLRATGKLVKGTGSLKKRKTNGTSKVDEILGSR